MFSVVQTANINRIKLLMVMMPDDLLKNIHSTLMGQIFLLNSSQAYIENFKCSEHTQTLLESSFAFPAVGKC
ncbi:CLUMA_CG002892, isoform A [Clunio marinus]|uniref:CLUMA_CG002892, isoform A n=1 Tax=Clunio marinus TaxID=568069 RepID=A0A1J1HMG8_9DIPT|nr:CLUMA_CG002892, isoform A [Clunio marinus]